MANTIDLQAIDRGLGALAGLLQNADVRTTVAIFRADFVAASQQVDVLSDYKDLHDLLHDLQFECYNYIASQVARFPGDEVVIDSLLDHELTFMGLVAGLHEVAARPTVSGELTWITELSQAEAVLHQALEAKDQVALKRHCRLVRRVLDRYPSRVNERLNSAAKALRMDAIERALTTILDMLKTRVGASAEVASFAVGTASLVDLNQRLTCLVRDHDRWQDVDVELRRVEATMNSDPEELEISWPDIKARTIPLLCGEDESQAQALGRDSTRLEEALHANDPEKARRHFIHFQRQAAGHFYRVDKQLKMLCGQLRTIGAPLAAVAELVAAMPAPQSAQPPVVGFPIDATLIRREHWQRVLDELSRKYDALTKRIAAINNDIGRELDGERKLVLTERNDELMAEREELVNIRVQIESQLNRPAVA
jgi:hypothetical protein